jgi:hypothetical protein
MRPRLLWRLVVIQFVLLRHGLDEIVLALRIFRPIRFLKFFSPWYWLTDNRRRSRGERLVAALEDLGPIFVKFGQMLSTRRDLLPPDLAEALSALQDRVRPFPAEIARQRIETALGASVTEHFARFEAEPLASASIAQVHAATLDDGAEVIVKITRPGIHRRIRSDLEILYTVARLAERYWSEGPRLHPVEVVTEFDKTLMNELDLQREAANAAEIRRQFGDSPLLYVPEVYWDWCRTDVLVQERIHGIPVARTDLLHAAGVDMKRLAEIGVEVFFTQVFKHNFFHAGGIRHPAGFHMQLGHPTVVAVEEGVEVLGEIPLVLVGQRADDAEVHGHVARLGRVRRVDEDVARVHVGVEEVVLEHLGEEHLHAAFGQPLHVDVGRAQEIGARDRDAVDALLDEHVGTAPVPVDLGDVEHRRAGELTLEFGGVGRLALQVELVHQGLVELGDHRHRVQARALRPVALRQSRDRVEYFEIAADAPVDARAGDLDDHLLAVVERGGVHLGDGS